MLGERHKGMAAVSKTIALGSQKLAGNKNGKLKQQDAEKL